MRLQQLDYVIEANDGECICASSVRLPFEPKGAMKAMRDELGVSLQRLTRPSATLYAAYSSASNARCDAENVLFYNVGTARFRGLGQSEVMFERLYASPHRSEHHVHEMYYSTAITPSWTPQDVVARWEAPLVASGRGLALGVAPVWLAMKQADFANSDLGMHSPYGLRIEIHSPGANRPLLMAHLKTAFDGVVSGLHWYEGRRLDEVGKRLSVSLGLDEAVVRALLVKREGAALGARDLLWPFGGGVQWNPADDLCVHGHLIYREANECKLVGELFTVQPSPELEN